MNHRYDRPPPLRVEWLFVYEGEPLCSPAIGMNIESADRFLVTAAHWLSIRRRSGNPRLVTG